VNYEPVLQEEATEELTWARADRRWVRRRPMIAARATLTRSSQHSQTAFHRTPVQILANGGVLDRRLWTAALLGT
jgi:hypothetical protein